MALNNTSSVGTRSFDKELNQDVSDFHLPPNSWTQARNAINNSATGDLGRLGNEPSNLFCTNAPYTIIGTVHLEADFWAIFSTDDIDSEIGIFEESSCTYTTVTNDRCLGFNRKFLIKGASKANGTCTYNVYWDDGNQPSRYISMTIDPPGDNVYTNPNSPVPWIQSCTVVNGCNICVNTPDLDCDALRLARFIQTPCIEALRGVGAGTLLNGSYLVAIAYAVQGQRVSDWYVSNVQALFDHNNSASSLDVSLNQLDQTFDEVIIAIISVVNQQAVARQAGIYSTRQQSISFDIIENSWPIVPIEEIPIMTPVANKTDAMYNVTDYLLRVGPTSKEDFNYQPRANQIVTKWTSIEYPADYYRKGGNNTAYMRDEVYPFFIRWVYDTGDKSSSYHIPGRPSFPSDLTTIANADSVPETSVGLTPFNWIVYNTATVTSVAPVTLPDGGVQVAEGYMGYWESTEIYPDDKPQIWNAGVTVPPYAGTTALQYDLCGNPIRHHRFPEESLNPLVQTYNGTNNTIRVMGVKFENIQAPLMNDGITPIPGIVGYEILRGSRNGNKTVLAKGIINNMGTYTIEGGVTNRKGAYVNYPYNDLRLDPFLSQSETNWSGCSVFGGGGGETGYNPMGGPLSGTSGFSKRLFTFHGPETNFTNPYLSAKELKVYGEYNGDVTGWYAKSEKHPKEKLISNTAFLIAAVAGVGIAGLALNGKRTVKYVSPKNPGYSEANLPGLTTWTAPYGIGTATIATSATGIQTSPTFIDDTVLMALADGFVTAAGTAFDTSWDLGAVMGLNLTGGTSDTVYNTMTSLWNSANSSTKAYSSAAADMDQEDGVLKNVPAVFRLFAGLPVWFHYFTEGTDSILRLIKAMVRYRDFALRYHSHCFYNRYLNPSIGETRRVITDQEYLGPQITDFGFTVRVNNLYRARTVAIELGADLANPLLNDVTRVAASQVTALYDTDPWGNQALVDPTKHAFGPFTPGGFIGVAGGNAGSFYAGHTGVQVASSHYVALKQRVRNQYGQVNGVVQQPASFCPMALPAQGTGTSDVIFGGDIYLNRYTEKNTYFFFYEWLYNQPDGTQFNYPTYRMMPWPRFWANFDGFETSDFTTSVPSTILSGSTAGWILPNDYYNLDGLSCSGSVSVANAIRLSVRDAWFYLFSSGVKDFYVESEINNDLRDYGISDAEQFYDPYRYTDTKSMFDTAIIKAGNYYKYDQSLSVSKLFTSYISWGAAQSRTYDPYVAETCFVYNPTRLLYSLPDSESLRDNWLVYLANNYADFSSRITSIKAINKSGALIFFETESPVQFLGQDQLETTGGTKLTIGDGGLFSQPMQNILNADRPYEFGSCQDRLSAISTPAGVFWICQNQGKIYNFTGSVEEVSMMDLKWWFARYLPYKLTEQFPTFSLTDNPVIGIGCQSIYDNENQIVYFTKRDFIVRTDIPDTVTYLQDDQFGINCVTDPLGNVTCPLTVTLGDPRYFEDASWTVSYDPKSKAWIGWHDWHPNLLMPGKNTFMSILNNGIWIHNQRCDSYCNYYGVDYPFEVEYMVNTVQQVNTLRSVEYIMEVYKYAPNCHDRFHVLDFNFDECVVYNTEQCSGSLRLNLTPKNQPMLLIQYPIVNFNNIDILFSKEEQKYRFNQFWDITDDRGEFNPAAQRMIWNTAANGYVRVLNPNNLNYAKSPTERKKFRHYMNLVLLRRRVSGDRKILVMLTNNKNLYSPR